MTRFTFFNTETRRPEKNFDLFLHKCGISSNSARTPGSRMPTDMKTRELNDISYLIIQSAIEVHRGLAQVYWKACIEPAFYMSCDNGR